MLDLGFLKAMSPVELIINAMILLCANAIFASIIFNFISAQKRDKVIKERKSIVETGSMLLFFAIYYAVIRFEIGEFELPGSIRMVLIISGLIVLVIGTYVNITGRLALGKNWGNQIRVYSDHTLVTKGPYSMVRHPLYASLVWIFYAGSAIYSNYAAFILNTVIFIPFMVFRARQEESMLSEKFKGYRDYSNEVGMLFPHIRYLTNRKKQWTKR